MSIPSGSGKRGGFDDLMASMGVRRIAQERQPPGGRKGKKKKPAAGDGRNKAAPASPALPPATPPPPEVAAPPPEPTPPPQPTPPADPGELEALRDEVSALRATSQQAAEQARARDHLVAALADREHALDQARAELAATRRALARASGDPGADPPALVDLLHARGIKGPTELDAMLRGLAEERLGADLLRSLGVLDPAQVERFLADRLLLLGGCAECPALPGRVVLAVPRERCEVCRGADLAQTLRRFVDACLVNGLTRILLVGGQPKDHLVLRTLVVDRRISLVVVPAFLRRDPEQVAEDLSQAQVVALWQDGSLEPQVAAAYQAFDGPLLTVQAAGVGPLLEALARDLPSALDA